MIKRLQRIGRGRGIVIDKSLLDRLEIGEDDLVEVVADADGLLIRKAGGGETPAARPLPFGDAPPARAPASGRERARSRNPSQRPKTERPAGTDEGSGGERDQRVDAAAAPGPSGHAVAPRIRAWVDGGSRGNPGPAGYGAHIEDAEGRLLAEKSGYLGVTTNNVAEYQGLLAALRAALDLGARDVEILADSELMVRQMNGRYQVKNESLKRLFAQAKALAERIPRFKIRHVPRADNRKADRLANEAMDRGV